MPSAKREGGRAAAAAAAVQNQRPPNTEAVGKRSGGEVNVCYRFRMQMTPPPPTLTAAATHYCSRRGHPHTYVLCPLPLLISTQAQGSPPKSHKRRPPSLPPLLSQEQSNSRWYIRTHRGGYNTAHKVCIAVGIVHTHVLCKHTHTDHG